MMEQLVEGLPECANRLPELPLVQVIRLHLRRRCMDTACRSRRTTCFFLMAAAVFDAQAALTAETGDETLKNAVTKAGADPGPSTPVLLHKAVKDQVIYHPLNWERMLVSDPDSDTCGERPSVAVDADSVRDAEDDHGLPGLMRRRKFWSCGEWFCKASDSGK